MPALNREKKAVVLELSSRRELFSLVRKCPGIHFREIQRRNKLATGALSYNLQKLIEAGLVRTVRDGEYLRYYAQNVITADERKVIEVLRRKTLRDIVLCFLENTSCTNKELSLKHGLSPSTISLHLNKLVEENILNKNVTQGKMIYSLNEPELVYKTLTLFKESWLDDIVDKFMETYRKTRF